MFFHVCNPADKTFLDYINPSSGPYYNVVIFVHDNEADLDTLNTNWIKPPGTQDLSGKSVQGILKRTLALTDLSGLSIGNYDNIEVSSYNLNVSTGNFYTTEAFGSIIFVHTSDDDISKIKTGSIPYKDYNLGS